jgi:hypothetical protein
MNGKKLNKQPISAVAQSDCSCNGIVIRLNQALSRRLVRPKLVGRVMEPRSNLYLTSSLNIVALFIQLVFTRLVKVSSFVVDLVLKPGNEAQANKWQPAITGIYFYELIIGRFCFSEYSDDISRRPTAVDSAWLSERHSLLRILVLAGCLACSGKCDQ